MGGIGEAIFGGSQNAGSPRIDQAPTMTAEQQGLLKQLNELMSGQLGQGIDPYQGDLTAPASPLQNQAWGQISQLLSGGTQSDTSRQAIDRILQGTTNVPGAVDVEGYDVGEFDPTAIQTWYQDALVNPAMSTWEQSVVPQVQEKFIGQNAGSSGAANRAIAGSAENMMTGLNAQLANALFGEKQAFDTREFAAGMDKAGKQFQSETDFVNRLFSSGQGDLDRMTAIPGLENQSMESFFRAIGLGEGAGATQRDISQQGLNEAFSRWQAGQAYNNPWLNLLNSALGQSSFENVVQPDIQKSGLLQDLIAPVATAWAGSGFK